MGAVAGINQVGVAIDQAGRDPTPIEGEPLNRVPTGRQVGHRACEGDAPIQARDRARFDGAQAGTAGRERRQASIEPDPVVAHRNLAVCFLT
jgi:hypothetical protein